MNQRDQSLRRKVFQRDDYTCQKCKIQDNTNKILEVHHIIPLYSQGKDELFNLITLCNNCHHFAPDTKEEFNKYIKEEMDGELTILMKVWKQAIDNGLIEELNKEGNNLIR